MSYHTRYPPNRSVVKRDNSLNCTISSAGMCVSFSDVAKTWLKDYAITQGYQFVTLSVSVYKVSDTLSDDPIFTRFREIKPQFAVTDRYSVTVDPGVVDVKTFHYHRVDGPPYYSATLEEYLVKYESENDDGSEKWASNVNIMFDGKKLYDYLISQPMVHVLVPLTGKHTTTRFAFDYIFQ